jgi:hypothetical protein
MFSSNRTARGSDLEIFLIGDDLRRGRRLVLRPFRELFRSIQIGLQERDVHHRVDAK